jgi:hypothetical protein
MSLTNEKAHKTLDPHKRRKTKKRDHGISSGVSAAGDEGVVVFECFI